MVQDKEEDTVVAEVSDELDNLLSNLLDRMVFRSLRSSFGEL